MKGNSVPLPGALREFVNSAQWTFAKTYAATWPHEYIVREKSDNRSSSRLLPHSTTHGYEGGSTDSHSPISMKVIVSIGPWASRCARDGDCQSLPPGPDYEYRLAHNLLPEQQK